MVPNLTAKKSTGENTQQLHGCFSWFMGKTNGMRVISVKHTFNFLDKNPKSHFFMIYSLKYDGKIKKFSKKFILRKCFPPTPYLTMQ